MAYITKDSPQYRGAATEGDAGPSNFYDTYLSQLQMPGGWSQLGYAGPWNPNAWQTEGGSGEATQAAEEAVLREWLASNGYQVGTDTSTATNALLDRSGNAVAGSEYSVDDTGDFMRDAALLVAGGYFGGNALSGAYGSGAAATTGGAGTISGGSGLSAAGSASGAGLTTGTGLGGTGAGLSVGGAAGGTATGLSSTGLGTAAAGGGMSSAGTSLADFFSGNGSTSDYMRAGQALYGMYSQNKATDAAMQGNANQLALQREMWQANQAENKPLVDMRNSVLPQISNLLQNPSSITSQPDYQFGLQQGANRMNNRAAASGNYYSGAQMKAANQYGQDYAGTKLDQSLNRLMGVATGTQVGSQNNQNANNQFAVAGGNALQQGGNIRAGGYIGQYNTVNNNLNDWMQDQTNRKYWGGGS